MQDNKYLLCSFESNCDINGQWSCFYCISCTKFNRYIRLITVSEKIISFSVVFTAYLSLNYRNNFEDNYFEIARTDFVKTNKTASALRLHGTIEPESLI